MESETALSNLVCNEDVSALNEPIKSKDEDLEFCSISESDFEFLETSVQREISFQWSQRRWLKCARSDAIKWILETRALFGYHYHTAYLSVIYFDRFLTRRWISDEQWWTVRMLSVACLSLAAKMEEVEAVALSQYCVEGYSFQGNVIQRMELLVLHTLGWKMNYVTPFAYLNYFATKFCLQPRPKELIIQAAELILAIMEGINIVEHRSSVIAAAAVLAAYDCRLTKMTVESKMDVFPSWGSLEKENAFSCYCLLQEILMLKTPKSFVSPNSLPTDDSTITSRGGTRRRLNLDDGDQDCPAQKISKS